MKKRTVSLLAKVLVLSMLLGILPTFGTARAAGPEVSNTQTVAELKGFRSEQFLRENSYRYADSDIVRAIVILKNAPVVDFKPNGAAPRSVATKAETAQAVKIAKEHTTVFKSMAAKRIDYKIAYEFDTLLNGFSCDVEYGKLDAIADLPEVDAVYIANTYSIPEEPKMSSSNELTGNAAMNSAYSAGKDTVIAILDTGINVDHDAFQVHDEKYQYGPLTEKDAARAVAKGAYISEKIPFVYDYADQDDDVSESPLGEGHGSHVAGIAAGYAVDEEGVVVFSGAAPAAQLVFMKVFNDEDDTTTSDIYFAALEDAFRLGVDVINMSLGSDSGFTHDSTLDTELFGNIYKRLDAEGIVVCCSAGNSGSMLDYGGYGDGTSTKGFIGPDYTDYGVVGNPSTYEGTVSVASMENASYPSYAITLNGQNYEYTDTSDATDSNNWMIAFGGKTVEYVVVTDSEGEMSLGDLEDYEDIDVQGKIAVVKRGEIDFETKMNNAAEAGAAGIVVVNNEDGIINMQISEFAIPAIAVMKTVGEVFMDALSGSLTTPADKVTVASDEAGRMSAFSGWGTTPDLTMKPTITSVGGYINSVDAETTDGYLLMSGSSMASPNMAGTFANVLSWLKDKGCKDLSETAKALLESTAGLIYDEYGVLYSVRNQGTGLGLADKAIEAYENGYITDPIKELKDSDTGEFSFTVTLKNNSNSDITYTPNAAVMTDLINGYGENTLHSEYLYNDFAGDEEDNSDYYIIADDALVTVTVDGVELGGNSTAVTVPANKTASVKVTVELTAEGKAYLEQQGFENGAFVEGYVQFSADGLTPVHATFLGYNGDWTKAPALEQVDFRDYLEVVDFLKYDPDGQAIFEEIYEIYMGSGIEITEEDAAALLLDVVTSYNSAAIVDSDGYGVNAGSNMLGDAVFNEKHITLSTSESDAETVYYNTLYVAPYELRNVKELKMTVKDEEGTVYYEESAEYLPKSINQNGTWYIYKAFRWDGNDLDGNPVPDGTKLTVSVDATLPYKDTVQKDAWSFDLTIDSKAPVIESAEYDSETATITVTASDNQYLAGIALVDDYGDIIDQKLFSDDEADQSHTVTFTDEFGIWDLMGYQSFSVVALDYATNQTEVLVPLVDPELLGQTATIKLVSPDGTRRVNAIIGEDFAFPGCDDEVPSNYEFIGWVNQECDDVGYRDLYTLGGIYLEGDSVMVTGDATYYALYKEGEPVVFEQPRYTYYQQDDYSGEWAIVGWPYVLDEEYGASYSNSEDPYVLTADAVTSELITYDPDSEINIGGTVCFESGKEGLYYTFTKLADGTYTVKNAESGKYLAYVDGVLTESDSDSDESAHWIIETNLLYEGVFMSPASAPDMYLLFDDGNMSFMMTDEVFVESIPGFGDFKLADYMLMLYRRAEQEIDDYTATYTTKLPSSNPPHVPVPVTPGEKPTKEDPVAKFVDVEKGAWYYDGVEYMVGRKLMVGIDDTTFAPNATTTRSMVVSILYRLDGEPEAGSSTFADVPDGLWYSKAVAWAAANKIVSGYSDTQFGPDDPITREQMAAFLYRYAQYKKADLTAENDLSGYADAGKLSSWAEDAMRWAVGNKIIVGLSDTELSPNSLSTRAMVAEILTRYCQIFEK